MGTTQSVMYIAPALNIKMGLRVRLFTSCAIQILVCLMETLETLIVQVPVNTRMSRLIFYSYMYDL